MSDITKYVTNLKFTRLHLTTAVQKFSSPDKVTEPWHQIFIKSWSETQGEGNGDIKSDYGAFQVVKSKELTKSLDDVAVKSAVVGVGAVESSFLVHSQLVEIDNYNHEDIAPLMVCLPFCLTQTKFVTIIWIIYVGFAQYLLQLLANWTRVPIFEQEVKKVENFR